MPHKRNPITGERLTGLARVLRGNAIAAMENVALWHERDISHSSVERIIFPDSCTLLDYMLVTLTKLVDGLVVYPENMNKNLRLLAAGALGLPAFALGAPSDYVRTPSVEYGEREIELSTAFRHGLRLAVPGQQARVNLPLVVAVRDNGRGVSDELRSHLFDAFVTNKPTGTGLGLALVAKIINDHGGAIEYDSEPGRTTFRVMLPMQSPQAAP